MRLPKPWPLSIVVLFAGLRVDGGWALLVSLCFCHQTQKAKIMIVKGMVAARKYHHSGRTSSTDLPFSSTVVLKKVMLKMAYTT